MCVKGGGTKRTQRKVSQQGEGTEIWSPAEKGIARRGGRERAKKIHSPHTHGSNRGYVVAREKVKV